VVCLLRAAAYTGVVVFKWDPKKAAANLRKHQIDFHEAVTVLRDPLSTTFEEGLMIRVRNTILPQ